MREKFPAVALCAAALVGVLAPSAAAAHAPPLPLPAAGGEPLITEGVGIEGPLINNVSLPTLK
ncbi:hypothetical protein [Streptomyces africanus]|uniref:hypothetical protein n=1 Tax=Streptomyces africanus TaxID=231024 RepID=UPI000A38CA3B|nr:hypothetical protein [Streptomyces africanus]